MSFEHEALMYAGDESFCDSLVPFIREGVVADEPLLVMVGAKKIELLKARLNGHADGVLFADMEEVGRNPARIISAWREFIADHGQPGRPMRGVGEPIWAGRSAAELVECQHHESLLNLAFADDGPFRLLCLYDTAALPAEVIEEARRSHPLVCDHTRGTGTSSASESYRGLDRITGPLTDPLPEAPSHARPIEFDSEHLSGVRHYVAGAARAANLSPGRTDDLVLAVSEVATNGVIHGGGGGTLRTWAQDGSLVCELRDAGRIGHPLAGRERPAVGRSGGYGLWLVNQVCDLVQVRSLEDGTLVRLHMHVS